MCYSLSRNIYTYLSKELKFFMHFSFTLMKASMRKWMGYSLSREKWYKLRENIFLVRLSYNPFIIPDSRMGLNGAYKAGLLREAAKKFYQGPSPTSLVDQWLFFNWFFLFLVVNDQKKILKKNIFALKNYKYLVWNGSYL